MSENKANKLTIPLQNIWYYGGGESGRFKGVRACSIHDVDDRIFITPDQFLVHMRGEA